MSRIDMNKCLHCPAVSFCDGEPLTHQNCLREDDAKPKKTKRRTNDD
jgi:hypothetical protein